MSCSCGNSIYSDWLRLNSNWAFLATFFQHSLLARNGFFTTPILNLWNSNLPLDVSFVNMRASCSLVRIYCSNIILLYTQSCKWWYQISMCLDLSWSIKFSESLMKLWLSRYIIIGSISWLKIRTSIFLIHMASHISWLPTMYLASPELSTTNRCFLLYQEIATYRHWR